MKNDFLVLKFGSELVIDSDKIRQYAGGICKTYQHYSLIIVTSGAVAAGRKRLKAKNINITEYDDATLAQLGSASIMRDWEQAFDLQDFTAGGLLVTHHEIQSLSEGRNFLQTLKLAQKQRVISIINENDALSDTELIELAYGGDNDGLASHIARSISAKELIIFTKNGGVLNQDNELIHMVNDSNINHIKEMLSRRMNDDKSIGRGGIYKKTEAAWEAALSGIRTKIAAVNDDMTGSMVTEFVVG